jgi:hypothetical protein
VRSVDRTHENSGIDCASSEFISIALPKAYSSRVRNALAASAKSVALKQLGGGPFFQSGVALENRYALLAAVTGVRS